MSSGAVPQNATRAAGSRTAYLGAVLKRYGKEILLCVAFWAMVTGAAAVAWSSGLTLFTDSPAATITLNAKHLWRKGNLRDPRFEQIRAELEAGTRSNPGARGMQDVFAVGKDGELYPKHSLLVTVLSAPVYGLLGDFGFWLLNQLVLFGTLAGVYKMGQRLGSAFAATLVVASVPLTAGYLLVYSYLPLYEYAPACCVVWALLLLEKRPWLAGFVFSLAPWVRMSEIFFFPFVLLTLGPPSLPRMRTYRWAALGLACGLAPLLATNEWIWGSPLSGAYLHGVYFENGELVSSAALHRFDPVFLMEWKARLLDPDEGVLACLPLWGLVPVFLALWPGGKDRWALGGLLAGACGYLVVMLSYSYWLDAGGPRMLFSATAMLLVVSVHYTHRLLTPARQRTTAPAISPSRAATR